MKKAWLFGLLLFLCTSVRAQIPSRDTLVQRIFRAVKENNEQAFLRLFPSYSQLRALFDDLLSHTSDSGTRALMRARFSELTEKVYDVKLRSEMGESFRTLIKQGNDKGVQWSTLQFTGSVLEEENNEDFDGRQLSGIIHLSDGQHEYDLHFDETIWSRQHQGWFGALLKGIVKKGEPVEELLERVDSVVLDTTVLISETKPAPPPPPPALPKKSTKKKGAGPVKKSEPAYKRED